MTGLWKRLFGLSFGFSTSKCGSRSEIGTEAASGFSFEGVRGSSITMKPPHRTTVRVRYGETDQMGFVYHANYVPYFELGRTEFMREADLCYAEMEKEGMALAVVDLNVRYLRPAFYDQELVIETRLASASRVRLRFEYRILREPAEKAGAGGPNAASSEGAPEVLCEGHTTLACLGPDGRPTRIRPPYVGLITKLVHSD